MWIILGISILWWAVFWVWTGNDVESGAIVSGSVNETQNWSIVDPTKWTIVTNNKRPIWVLMNELIYRPIFNILFALLAIFWSNLGIAIIFLTIIIRWALLKPAMAWNDAQKHMVDLQPKIKEIQEKYKDDPVTMQAEMMKIMKSKWMWPLKWCLMLLIQMPVFIGLFFVIRHFSEKKIDLTDIYSFLYNWVEPVQHNIQNIFLSVDLFGSWGVHGFILAIVAWILMWMQIKLTMMNKPAMPQTQSIPWVNMPDMSKFMDMMNTFMIFMMAAFVMSMQAWIWVYIIVSTLFTIIQYSIQYKELLKVKMKVLFAKK